MYIVQPFLSVRLITENNKMIFLGWIEIKTRLKPLTKQEYNQVSKPFTCVGLYLDYFLYRFYLLHLPAITITSGLGINMVLYSFLGLEVGEHFFFLF